MGDSTGFVNGMVRDPTTAASSRQALPGTHHRRVISPTPERPPGSSWSRSHVPVVAKHQREFHRIAAGRRRRRCRSRCDSMIDSVFGTVVFAAIVRDAASLERSRRRSIRSFRLHAWAVVVEVHVGEDLRIGAAHRDAQSLLALIGRQILDRAVAIAVMMIQDTRRAPGGTPAGFGTGRARMSTRTRPRWRRRRRGICASNQPRFRCCDVVARRLSAEYPPLA